MSQHILDAPAASAPAKCGPLRRLLAAHPIGFWFLFWGELAERCSYYSMRAILMLYMLEMLGLSKATASMVMSYFVAGCYLLPLVGGWVADRFLGQYWTIVLFSVPYLIGHLLLGVQSVPLLAMALVLLAVGSGAVKPNMTPLMGLTYKQQRPGDDKLLSDAFALFYGAINVGGFIASFGMPMLRTEYGYPFAFLAAAGMMAVAFTIFAAGKPFYAVESRVKETVTDTDRKERRAVLIRLLGLFGLVAAFWCVADQAGTTWLLMAKDHMNLQVLGYTLDPDQVQAANPLLLVLMLPAFAWGWRVLARRGWTVRATDKMLIGFILTCASMVVMAVAGFQVGGGEKVTVMWQLAAFVLITAAEVCISVVGLELAFRVAPKNMQGQAMAGFLLSVFVANVANAQITPLYEVISPGWYFTVLAVLMVPVTLVFRKVSARFEK